MTSYKMRNKLSDIDSFASLEQDFILNLIKSSLWLFIECKKHRPEQVE